MGFFGKRKAANFAQKIKKVADKAGMKVLESSDSLVIANFNIGGNRQQRVGLTPLGDLLGCTIVGIFSLALEISGDLDPNLANRLLKENGRHKIGYWGITKGTDKSFLGIHHSMILETLDPEELRIVLDTLATMADGLEKELGPGTDKF